MMNKNDKNSDVDDVFAELRKSEPYLADDGFTDIVLQQLAEQPVWQHRLRRHRLWILAALIGSTLSLATLTVMGVPAAEIIGDIGEQVQNLRVFAVAGVLVATFAAAAVVFGDRLR